MVGYDIHGRQLKLKPGDIILFLADPDKDHVILVESVEDNGDYITVHSVDGNHNDAVVTATWRIEKRPANARTIITARTVMLILSTVPTGALQAR